jgi:hypothetical protein
MALIWMAVSYQSIFENASFVFFLFQRKGIPMIQEQKLIEEGDFRHG